MHRRFLLTTLLFYFTGFCFAQKAKDSLPDDTALIDYEEFFSELDLLLDSLTTPHNFTLINIGIGQSFLSYESKSSLAETRRRFVYAPSIGHNDKSGLGLSVGASLVNDGSHLNPYQFSVTGSYDYHKSKAFITGLSLTHYFTKNDLPFYTSPLQNEAYAYFNYRKLWFKPSVAFSYGWGSRDNYEEVEEKIQNINLAQRGFTRINTAEKVIDVSLMATVRHDYYFLNALGGDYIRLTPQFTFTSGSQQFGFNQTSNTYVTLRRTGANVLYNTDNVTFDNQFYFQPISLTAFLKAEWSKGKFYVQPQFLLDYYFPASTDNFTPAFFLNTGLMF